MGGSSGAIVGPPGDQRPGSGEACSRDPRPSLCVAAEGPQSRCSPPPPPPPSLLAQPLFGSYLRNALSPLPRSCLGTRGARLSPVPRHCSTAAWSQPRWALTRAAARLLPHMPSMAITQPPHRPSSPTHALSSPVLHSAPSPASSNGNLSTVTPFPPSAPPPPRHPFHGCPSCTAPRLQRARGAHAVTHLALGVQAPGTPAPSTAHPDAAVPHGACVPRPTPQPPCMAHMCQPISWHQRGSGGSLQAQPCAMWPGDEGHAAPGPEVMGGGWSGCAPCCRNGISEWESGCPVPTGGCQTMIRAGDGSSQDGTPR